MPNERCLSTHTRGSPRSISFSPKIWRKEKGCAVCICGPGPCLTSEAAHTTIESVVSPTQSIGIDRSGEAQVYYGDRVITGCHYELNGATWPNSPCDRPTS